MMMPELTLTLFVLLGRADDEHLAVTADDFALFAAFLNRGAYLHNVSLTLLHNGIIYSGKEYGPASDR